MTLSNLDTLLEKAFESEGALADANKVYTSFLRNTVYVPIEKNPEIESLSSEEPFRPLFVHHQQHAFMMCFSDLDKLTAWAGEYLHEMDYVSMRGQDLIRGVGLTVYVCLNYGGETYKEFCPEEIKHLKNIIAKMDRMVKSQSKKNAG